MPAPLRTPTHRPAVGIHALVALAVLLIAAGVPAVSAEIVINEELNVSIDTSVSGTNTYTGSGGSTNPSTPSTLLGFDNIQNHKDLSYIGLEFSGNMTPTLNNGENEATYTLNGVTKPCIVYVSRSTNILGQVTKTKILIFPQNWDVGNLQGYKTVKFSFPFGNGLGYYNGIVSQPVPIYLIPDMYPSGSFRINGYYAIASASIWKNNLIVNTTSYPEGYYVSLERIVDGVEYASTLNITKDNIIVVNHNSDNEPYLGWFSKNDIDTIEITNSLDKNFIFKLDDHGSDAPGESFLVNVYVRNSQTGALLADAHIVISAIVDGEFHEVVNKTLPGGIYNGPLQPTGGGLPNPDYYRLIASADGYNAIMPYLDFEHGSATTLIVEMEPTSGGPEDDNKTFVEFYVRDMAANPISDATVTCGPYTLITNSAGYTQFKMPVNATYPYTVTKSGYVTIEGRATVADGPRYVVNVVLGPGETPTSTPTPTPTGWGPGQWTPDPDESLGDNARGAAKQTLVEGLQAGQLLFTLCILVLIMAVLDSRRR